MSRREKLEQLLQSEPDDAFLNFGLAMEYVKEGRVDEAVAQFDRTMTIDPDYTAAHHLKGQVLAAAGRVAEARDALRAGLEAAKRVGNQHAVEEMSELLAQLDE